MDHTFYRTNCSMSWSYIGPTTVCFIPYLILHLHKQDNLRHGQNGASQIHGWHSLGGSPDSQQMHSLITVTVDSSFIFTISKTMELCCCRKTTSSDATHTLLHPLEIKGQDVEQVEAFRYLGGKKNCLLHSIYVYKKACHQQHWQHCKEQWNLSIFNLFAYQDFGAIFTFISCVSLCSCVLKSLVTSKKNFPLLLKWTIKFFCSIQLQHSKHSFLFLIQHALKI